MSDLYDIELFEGISDTEREWLVNNSREVTLERGTIFLKEGEVNNQFYVVLEGELQITRKTNGTPVVMGTTPRGIMGGELGLLAGAAASATAQAIMPCRLMVFNEPEFRALFGMCPVVGTRILQTAAQRMSGNAERLKQNEKLAALGKFAAGLAHELNNPAAAARRATQTLRELLPDLQDQTMRLNTLGLTEKQMQHLNTIQRDTIANAGHAPVLSPLERSRREDEISDWLDEIGVSKGWEVSPVYVNAGVTLDDLQALLEQYPQDSRDEMAQWFSCAIEAASLLDEIQESSKRISDLVAAIKEYTYMDQAPTQEVDIHKNLENTLRMLNHKLKNTKIDRVYDPELPLIVGRGSELNQVWMNLIDNAIDAMKGEGTLRLITRPENDFVMIEVADNGPGIPLDIQQHIFEPFFTTKDVGVGTGMGLDISYRIIKQHNGTIEVQSHPGNTRFIVRIPVNSNQPM